MPKRDPAELLAMLTCRSTDVLSSGGGGKPTLTQQDVAAMMAGLAYEEAELVRVKYCDEPRHRLWRWWFQELMRQGWSEGNGRVEKLSIVTLEECIKPRVCGACKGVAKLQIDNRWLDCEACDGLGRFHLYEREVARLLGLKGSLQAPWLERLDFCRKWLARIEYGALEKMANQ